MQIEVTQKDSETLVKLNDLSFAVPQQWFWKQFADNWEPQTYAFFEKNLIRDTAYLDIGAWIGPTALYATALGASRLKLVEPNPVNFFLLLSTQISNQLFDRWFLVNACLSAKRGSEMIGPISGIKSGSSATNIREEHKDGAEIIALKLADIATEEEHFSLVKIDIEGAEAFVVKDLSLFQKRSSAIWLSLHPPFITDKEEFLADLMSLEDGFYFVDENNAQIANATLSDRILTTEEKPEWGTEWGNFFEIGLLPKQHFEENGTRKQ